jgi:hypothetical protein
VAGSGWAEISWVIASSEPHIHRRVMNILSSEY